MAFLPRLSNFVPKTPMATLRFMIFPVIGLYNFINNDIKR
ncbi:hypothetical protein XBKQ1_2320010 [Xenorhabdus bovienii str. kraussei Quebec]|uniref:Uncharacterized protein n=1 Tax=Xenorhabdus bovienii str. kraussei Quebec TaxID=1398203 RepID=A0A077PGG3_XENBV|nr:hypothetical protein XBKQ1_2320010 [Xenorhabdus bovienii str. kraussei Quebec]